MDREQLIHEFLREKCNIENPPEAGVPFITISRQAGAGGHLLAYVLLSEYLKFKREPLFTGWQVFDREICQIILQDKQVKESMDALRAEHFKPEITDFVESMFTGRSRPYQLYKETFIVVRMLARLGKVILVGRAGNCVTRGIPGGLHIRLIAPEEQRVIWMMKRFKLTKNEARTIAAKQDEDRRRLTKTFFNRDIDDPLLYDAIFNTASMTMYEISSAVIQFVRHRAEKGTAETNTHREYE